MLNFKIGFDLVLVGEGLEVLVAYIYGDSKGSFKVGWFGMT